MRRWQFPGIVLAAFLLSVPPAAAQDQMDAGQAAAGNILFEAKCRHCHGAADLAQKYFAPDGAGSEAFTRKLRRHGGTDESGDRDIAAFLEVLAEGDGGSVDQGAASQ